MFLEACDVYFRHCHNKPYGFFNSEFFQIKVSQNKVPLHLRLALIACATRYSSRSQWKERKQSTIDGYARASWELIASSPDGIDGNEDVSLIQSLAILGVIDATGELVLMSAKMNKIHAKSSLSWPAKGSVDQNRNGGANQPRLEHDGRTQL